MVIFSIFSKLSPLPASSNPEPSNPSCILFLSAEQPTEIKHCKSTLLHTFYSRIHPSCTIVMVNVEQHQTFYFVAAVISPNAGLV